METAKLITPKELFSAFKMRGVNSNNIQTITSFRSSTGMLNTIGRKAGPVVLAEYLERIAAATHNVPVCQKYYTLINEAFPEIKILEAVRLCVREFFPEIRKGAYYPSAKQVIERMGVETTPKKASIEDVKTVFLQVVKLLGMNAKLVLMPEGHMLNLNNFAEEIGGADPEEVLRIFLEANIEAVQNIKAFVLANQTLEVLPEPMRLLTGVKNLTLKGCGLTEIPRWIHEWKDLHVLTSTGNPISHIPFEMMLLKLNRIQIHGKVLTEGEVQEPGTKITRLPRWVGRMDSLKYLLLPDNEISSIPTDDLLDERLQKIFALSRVHFNLTGNQIPVMDLALRGLIAQKPRTTK